MRKITNLLMLTISMMVFIACEKENGDLGFDVGTGELINLKIEIPIVTYTYQEDLDTVRSDEVNLLAPVGISYTTPFGRMKSSFVSEFDYIGSYGTSLGEGVQLDSATLILSVFPQSVDSDYLNSPEANLRVLSGETVEDVDTVLIDYKVDSIFSQTADNMNMKIYKLNDKLQVFSRAYYSNGIAYGTDIGDAPYVKGPQIGAGKLSVTAQDTAYVYYSESTEKYTLYKTLSSVHYHLPLNKSVFEPIFSDVQSGAISNATLLKQRFSGLAIEADGTAGFVVETIPTASHIRLYYSYGVDTDDDGANDSIVNKYTSLNIGSTTEHRFNRYEHDYSTADASFKTQLTNPNVTTGEESLYLQGMGSTRVMMKIDDQALQSFKEAAKNKDGAMNMIISDAYITMHVDSDKSQNLDLPFWLHLYDYDNKREISDYARSSYAGSSSSDDYRKLVGGIYDPEKGIYKFKVTEYIRNLIEDKTFVDVYDVNENGNTTEELLYENVHLAVEIGQHVSNVFVTSLNSMIYQTDTRYQEGNAVFVGNRTMDTAKQLKLIIEYTQRK